MNSRNPDSHRNWLVEFKKFVQASGDIPQGVSPLLFKHVRSDLNPSLKLIFAKGLTIHGFVATFSLIFCPQFGIGPLGGGMGLMRSFMTLGPSWCAVLCGATFLGLSSLLTAFLLRPEEIRRANNFGYAYIPLITTLSFIALMLGGGTADLETLVLWSIGALLAGWGFLKLGAILRLGRVVL